MSTGARTHKNQPIVVVGGGLVGMAVARALARAGAPVTLVERGVPGAEASWAAGGILSPQAECDVDGPMLRLCLRGLAEARVLARELHEELGHSLGWRDGGTLDVARTDDEERTLRARVAWQEALGLQAAWWTASEVRARFPALGDVTGGAWFGAEASLEPRLLHAALRESAHKAGVGFVVGRRVLGVDADHVVLEGGQGPGERGERGERLEASAVVVCAGAWTPQVRGTGVVEHAVFPVRGVMVEIDGGAVGRSFDAVVYGHGGYVVPRLDGRVLVGSTMERAGFDKTITTGALSSVLARAVALVPGLVEQPVLTHWAGLRPGTPDGLPLLGRSPSGVWIASGHFRNGVLLAAASGVWMRDALLHGAALDDACAPTRFV